MRTRPHTKALPALPSTIETPAGPWRVVRGEPDGNPDDGVWGKCDYASRTITIKPGIARTLAHLTLEHERIHAILFDAGVKLSTAKEEAVCDAIAMARVAELRTT